MAARTSKQILAALATLQTGQAQLLDVVARIEQLLTGGIRDAAELDLLGALWSEMNNQPFTVRQAISRAKQPPAQALRDALEAAGVDSARSLGWSLLRLAHEMTGPIEVLRLTERRDGVLWQLRPRVLRVSVEKPA